MYMYLLICVVNVSLFSINYTRAEVTVVSGGVLMGLGRDGLKNLRSVLSYTWS